MSLPIAAFGALLAALLETSVLTELTVAGIKPDLILVLTVVVAMRVGFEDGLAWAVVGGLVVDILQGRPLGATMLALLVVIGFAVLLARVAGGTQPRSLFVAASTFALAWVFHLLLLGLLAVTTGVGAGELPVARLVAIAVLDSVLAFLLARLVTLIDRRFASPQERLEW